MSSSVLESTPNVTSRPATMAPQPRDLRLDFFRGLALAMIFVNHTSGNWLSSVTLQRLGFADAAEMFVLIAGIAAAFAYRKIFLRDGLAAALRATLARSFTLYAIHVVLTVAVIVMAGFAIVLGTGFDIVGKLGLQPFQDDPLAAAIRIPLLAYQPHYLDILPLYVVLLACLPFILAGFRIHVLLPVLAATGLYLWAQATGANLPNLTEGRGWFFNPFAWGLLFVIGATIAELTARGAWSRCPQIVLNAITVLALVWVSVAFVYAAPWTQLTGWEQAYFAALAFQPDKTMLSWHRLFDILAKAWLAAVFVPRAAAWMATGVGGALSLLGRHSLPVFTAGIVLSIALSAALHDAGGSAVAQLMVNTIGLGAMLLLAWWLNGGSFARARRLIIVKINRSELLPLRSR